MQSSQGASLQQSVAKSDSERECGYHRVLRVARTLADLDAAATVTRLHMAEALSYRRLSLAR